MPQISLNECLYPLHVGPGVREVHQQQRSVSEGRQKTSVEPKSSSSSDPSTKASTQSVLVRHKEHGKRRRLPRQGFRTTIPYSLLRYFYIGSYGREGQSQKYHATKNAGAALVKPVSTPITETKGVNADCGLVSHGRYGEASQPVTSGESLNFPPGH